MAYRKTLLNHLFPINNTNCWLHLKTLSRRFSLYSKVIHHFKICTVPENINTHPRKVNYKGQGFSKAKPFYRSMNLNLNFQGCWGEEFKLKNIPCWVQIFSGNTILIPVTDSEVHKGEGRLSADGPSLARKGRVEIKISVPQIR